MVATCAFFVLPNYPTTTRWLSEDEKRLAVARLLYNENGDSATGEGEQISHWTAFKLAIKDFKTWVFVLW